MKDGRFYAIAYHQFEEDVCNIMAVDSCWMIIWYNPISNIYFRAVIDTDDIFGPRIYFTPGKEMETKEVDSWIKDPSEYEDMKWTAYMLVFSGYRPKILND